MFFDSHTAVVGGDNTNTNDPTPTNPFSVVRRDPNASPSQQDTTHTIKRHDPNATPQPTTNNTNISNSGKRDPNAAKLQQRTGNNISRFDPNATPQDTTTTTTTSISRIDPNATPQQERDSSNSGKRDPNTSNGDGGVQNLQNKGVGVSDAHQKNLASR
jgi:hypothetical protein